MDFKQELTSLLNRHSKENGSDTPDWVLAEYLIGCLDNWNTAMLQRESWHGRSLGDWMHYAQPPEHTVSKRRTVGDWMP